jgi:hypothetical protein
MSFGHKKKKRNREIGSEDLTYYLHLLDDAASKLAKGARLLHSHQP